MTIGLTEVRQHFLATGYFDAAQEVITGGTASTTALEGSTEAAQFTRRKRGAHATKETYAVGLSSTQIRLSPFLDANNQDVRTTRYQ